MRPAIGGGRQEQQGSPLSRHQRVPPPAGFPCFQKVPFSPQNQQLCLAFYKPRDVFSTAPQRGIGNARSPNAIRGASPWDEHPSQQSRLLFNPPPAPWAARGWSGHGGCSSEGSSGAAAAHACGVLPRLEEREFGRLRQRSCSTAILTGARENSEASV